MRASHLLAGVVGFLGCSCLYLASLAVFDMLDADARKGPVALWIYTPLAGPGQVGAAKVGVYAGSAAGIRQVRTSIDGHAAGVFDGPGRTWGSTITRTSYGTGRGETDFTYRIPPDLPEGEHTLRAEIDYVYGLGGATGFSNEDGHATLETKLDVHASSLLGRAFRTLAALAAAALAFLFFRAVARPLGAWVKADDADAAREGRRSGGAALGMFFIATSMVYVLAGYPLSARPLAAAIGTPVVIVPAMIAWGVLAIVGLVAGRRRPRPPPRLDAAVRLLAARPEPAADVAGYRDGRAKDAPKRDAVELCKVLADLRLRRRGGRMRTLFGFAARVAIEVADPEDLGAGIRIEAPRPLLARTLSQLAGAFGALDATVGTTTVHVEPAATEADVTRDLPSGA